MLANNGRYDTLCVAEKICQLRMSEQTGIYSMRTIWQAYDDFDPAAAATAGLECLLSSQFASVLRGDQS